MRLSKAWLLSFGLLLGQDVHAEQGVQRARWVIIATLTDRTTGAPIKEVELGPELEFADPVECKAVVDKVKPVQTDQIATVLTCRRIERAPGTFL